MIDRGGQPELVTIFCCEVDDRVQEIADFVRSRQGQLSGSLNGNEYAISIAQVYYIESVDDYSFLYCESKVYEAKQRLCEREQLLTYVLSMFGRVV